MATRPEAYTAAHEGLRSRLFTLTTRLGKLDLAEHAVFDSFSKEFAVTVNLIKFHDRWETERIHPLLNDRVPGGAEQLAFEHKTIEHQLEVLAKHVEKIRAQADNKERRQALGLECYLALNSLIAFFLQHLDTKEEQVQPTLWRLCTDEEILTAMRHSTHGRTPELAAAHLRAMVPVETADELAAVLTWMELDASSDVVQDAFKQARRALHLKNEHV